MSADVIEQLRMLGDLLDAHAAPVTLDDIRRTELHEELGSGSVGVIETHVPMARRPTSARGSRGLAVAALAVAATLLGLIVIARRETGDVAPGENASASDAGPPAWYDLIAPSLPERFPYLALTLATHEQLFFVAFSPNDGKTLEIQLAAEGYRVESTASVDATGQWVETPQGWSVKTPEGLFVSVSCDLGVGGRDYAGPENSCEKTSGLPAFTKDEIHAVTNALATSIPLSIFDEDLGTPTGDSIDTAAATAMISFAVPGQQIAASDLGDGADHIYLIGVDVGIGAGSSSETLPALNAVTLPVGTSIRILHGVYPHPPADLSDQVRVIAASYDDAALVWTFGSGGVAVRISTTDTSPASLSRLEQLAQHLIELDPTATPDPTTADAGPAAQTTSTIGVCDQSNPPATVVVVNASDMLDMEIWWTSLLAASVPTVHFADPVKAVAQSPVSRVLALDGFDCDASLVANLTTGTAVEQATVETLQALVDQPLPSGTSIVVVIGDDSLSTAATGSTTTSSSAAP